MKYHKYFIIEADLMDVWENTIRSMTIVMDHKALEPEVKQGNSLELARDHGLIVANM